MIGSISSAWAAIWPLFLLVALFSCPALSSAAESVESLEAELSSATGTDRVDALNGLSSLHFRRSPDDSRAYATEARNLAEELGYEQGIAAAVANLGMSAYVVGDHLDALEFFSQASVMFEKSGDEEALARVWYMEGLIHRDLGNMTDSFAQLHRSLELRKKLGDTRGQAYSYNGLGISYRHVSDYERALEYFLLSLKLKEEIGGKRSIASTLHNIGSAYKNLENHELAKEYLARSLALKRERDDTRGVSITLNTLGNVERALGNEAQAMAHYTEALTLQESISYWDGMASTQNNIGQFHRERGDYAMANEFYRKALEYFEETGKQYSLANTLNNLGIVSTRTGETRIAEEYLLRALSVATELDAHELQQNSYEHLARLYETLGNLEEALRYQRLFADKRDTIFSSELSSRIASMQASFDLDRKQAEIAQLQSRNEVNESRLDAQRTVRDSLIMGLLGLFIGSTIIALMYRKQIAANRIIARKNEELEAALEEIATLRGLVPICSWCKKIRDDEGLWHQLEEYISAHSEARFSHGICPDCSQEAMEKIGEDLPEPA